MTKIQIISKGCIIVDENVCEKPWKLLSDTVSSGNYTVDLKSVYKDKENWLTHVCPDNMTVRVREVAS